jgi:ribosome-associated toxin RatA of RatAB toxin-antitoxin module
MTNKLKIKVLNKKNYNRFLKLVLYVSAIAFCFNITALSQNTIIELSPQEQADLKQGKVVLKGEKGAYYGQVLTKGKSEVAWEVLTDYDNFKNFLPNIAESKIVKEEGVVKIFEQVNIVDLWLVTKKFTVQIAATENRPQKVDFQLVKGDLGKLKGTWEVKTLPNDQVLITHRVTVAPVSKSEEAIFYGLYESSLESTLAAIATEITKRSQ